MDDCPKKLPTFLNSSALLIKAFAIVCFTLSGDCNTNPSTLSGTVFHIVTGHHGGIYIERHSVDFFKVRPAFKTNDLLN
jgi:hypothetical protein